MKASVKGAGKVRGKFSRSLLQGVKEAIAYAHGKQLGVKPHTFHIPKVRPKKGEV